MTMDTQIFNLGLSVSATSAYIIAVSLMDDGVPPTLEAIGARWNGAADDFENALKELLAWDILDRMPGADGRMRYVPNPASLWRRPGA